MPENRIRKQLKEEQKMNRSRTKRIFEITLVVLFLEALAGTIFAWKAPILYGVILPTLGIGMILYGIFDWYRPAKWTCWILGVCAVAYGVWLLLGPEGLRTITASTLFVVAGLFGGNGTNGPWWKNFRFPRSGNMSPSGTSTNTRSGRPGVATHRYLWWMLGLLLLVIILIGAFGGQ